MNGVKATGHVAKAQPRPRHRLTLLPAQEGNSPAAAVLAEITAFLAS
jgi:hypothetical protein